MAAPGVPGIPAIPPVQGKAEMALDAARVYAEEEAKRKRLECRFYEAQYPEIEEVVMVNVRNIAEMGAYVVLLEYNDIEGMILLSELSRRRIRSINKLIRVNRNEVAMVLRVDKEKVRIVSLCRTGQGSMCVHLSVISQRAHININTRYLQHGFPFSQSEVGRISFPQQQPRCVGCTAVKSHAAPKTAVLQSSQAFLVIVV